MKPHRNRNTYRPLPRRRRSNLPGFLIMFVGLLIALPGLISTVNTMIDLGLPIHHYFYDEIVSEDQIVFRFNTLHRAVIFAAALGGLILGLGMSRVSIHAIRSYAWFPAFMGIIIPIVFFWHTSEVFVTQEKIYEIVPAGERGVVFDQVDQITRWSKGGSIIWTLYRDQNFLQDLTFSDLWKAAENRLLEIAQERGIEVNRVEDLGRPVIRDD